MAIAEPDWERLIESATAKLPGASKAMLKNEVFDVMHEFFNLSSSWLENIAVPVVAGTVDYDLIPAEGQIIRLVAAVDSNNVPQPAFMPTLGTLHIVYPTNINVTYHAIVVKNVVMPTEKGNIPIAPEWLLPVWGPSILDGLLGRMMGQLSKSYSNPALSLYHLKRFLNAIADARSSTLRNNTFGAQAWNYPRFTRGTQRGGFSVGNVVSF